MRSGCWLLCSCRLLDQPTLYQCLPKSPSVPHKNPPSPRHPGVALRGMCCHPWMNLRWPSICRVLAAHRAYLRAFVCKQGTPMPLSPTTCLSLCRIPRFVTLFRYIELIMRNFLWSCPKLSTRPEEAGRSSCEQSPPSWALPLKSGADCGGRARTIFES